MENLSRFGRSFSIVRVPYAMKLLMQELMVLNIHMKIITDENVDQLMSMSYSSNYKLLLNPTSVDPTKIQGDVAVSKYADIIYNHLKEDKNKNVKVTNIEKFVARCDLNTIMRKERSINNNNKLKYITLLIMIIMTLTIFSSQRNMGKIEKKKVSCFRRRSRRERRRRNKKE